MTTIEKDVGDVIESIHKVNRDIRDYYWMANQLNVSDVESYVKVTYYGEEATLPGAPYSISDPTYRITQRNIRIEERHKRLMAKVLNLENAVATLEDERERMVIEGCMDRVTLKNIGSVLGISKQAAYEIKEKAVRKLAFEMYLKEENN